MASGWRQDGVRMRQDGVRQASHVCQGRGVGVRSASGCVGMRQEGVRVASGRRQDNLASGWRQDDVKRRGARIKWQELDPNELSHCQFHTSGLSRDGTGKHDYPASEWRLVPLGHWNWKWNQARSNYSTYDQELLAGMLVLSSQSRLLGNTLLYGSVTKSP